MMRPKLVRCRKCGRRLQRRHAVVYTGNYYGRCCWGKLQKQKDYIRYSDWALDERMKYHEELYGGKPR